MFGIETFPLGEMALVRAPRSGAVAMVDAPTCVILEGLAAGKRIAALARSHAAAMGGEVQAAAARIAELRRAWREFDTPFDSYVPQISAAVATEPVLDVRCRVGATAVRLRIWPPTLARIVAAVTAPARIAGGGEVSELILEIRRAQGRYHLRCNGEHLLATDDLMIARSETLRWLVLASHPRREWLAVLHAAAVAGPRGAALLCGCSGAGKSTLTGLLVASGLPLVTDDYAPVEMGTGLLWPVPFGLSAKEGSWPVLAPHFPDLGRAPLVRTRARRQRYVAPPLMMDGPLSAACLVFPLHQPGVQVELTPLEPAESLQLLTRSGGWYENSPDRLAALVDWIAALPAYALDYGDGADAVAAVRSLLGAR